MRPWNPQNSREQKSQAKAHKAFQALQKSSKTSSESAIAFSTPRSVVKPHMFESRYLKICCDSPVTSRSDQRKANTFCLEPSSPTARKKQRASLYSFVSTTLSTMLKLSNPQVGKNQPDNTTSGRFKHSKGVAKKCRVTLRDGGSTHVLAIAKSTNAALIVS